ncbi:DUF4262 domain-containing protein [Acinetobacter sp.]|uniref:DUF4262 domain-containing protein n=1 Tax=Acinetobacter sp. TaxID=472 RepID=UPI00375176A2
MKNIELVMKYGWVMMGIISTNTTPAYVYTVGFGVNPRFQGYDYVVVGMPASLAAATMAAATIDALYRNYLIPGIKITNDYVINEIANVPVIAKVLPKDLPCFGMGITVSNILREMVGMTPTEDYPMIQLCWPDKNGKYCWEPDYIKYNISHRSQKLMTHNWNDEENSAKEEN